MKVRFPKFLITRALIIPPSINHHTSKFCIFVAQKSLLVIVGEFFSNLCWKQPFSSMIPSWLWYIHITKMFVGITIIRCGTIRVITYVLYFSLIHDLHHRLNNGDIGNDLSLTGMHIMMTRHISQIIMDQQTLECDDYFTARWGQHFVAKLHICAFIRKRMWSDRCNNDQI